MVCSVESYCISAKVSVHVHCMYDCIAASEGKETDVTPWCLGLMANLCRNNVSLQTFVKGKVGYSCDVLHFHIFKFCFFVVCSALMG